jgi:hypothetical protein
MPTDHGAGAQSGWIGFDEGHVEDRIEIHPRRIEIVDQIGDPADPRWMHG